MQVDLLGKSIEKPKLCCYNNNNNSGETFEELEKRVASEYGRRHIGYPCDTAQDLPIDDRQEHIFNKNGTYKCKKCESLMNKLEIRINDEKNKIK
jgi:hypothetical protein